MTRSALRSTLTTILFLVPLLCPPAAFSEDAPQSLIERLADIEIELHELDHLENIETITRDEHTRRANTLRQEADTLWAPYKNKLPSDFISSLRSMIDTIVHTKLTLLGPQWQNEELAAQRAREARHKQTMAQVADDARHASDFQRQHPLLEKKLAKGGIRREDFTEPDAPLPQSRVPPPTAATAPGNGAGETTGTKPKPQGKGGHTSPSATGVFDHDVMLAAEHYLKEEEIRYRTSFKNTIPNRAETTEMASHNHARAAIEKRYSAISQQIGQDFYNAYIRAAEPGMQKLRAKYLPGSYVAPVVTRPAAPAPLPEETFWDTAFTWLKWAGIILGVLLALGLFGMFLQWMEQKPEPEKEPEPYQPPPLTTTYGSAAWAYPEIWPRRDPYRTAWGVMFGMGSLPGDKENRAPVVSLPERHTLIVAQTRAGKGTRVIVPTLLRYFQSILVIDPKGENAAITARCRRDTRGHTVHIVNPWGELAETFQSYSFPPATYNPLDAIDRDDSNSVAIAQNLAAVICPTTSGKDKFWQGSAANVLAAVFLWLADRPDQPKTLGRAREIVTQSRKAFQADLARMMASTAFDGAIKEMVSQYIDLAPETYGGIMANLAEATKFLSDPQIKAATNTSTFTFDHLRDQQTAVYFVIPNDKIDTHGTWLRLMLASAMQALKKRLRNPAKPKYRVMFLIDEFGSIGAMADLPRDIALMSGYGLDYTLIVQGLDQLRHHYDKAANTILANCAYKWFCNVSDLDTAKYLADSIGKSTVRTTSTSRSSSTTTSTSAGADGQAPRDTTSTTGNESTSYGETGRYLVTPDEIMNLGRNVAVLLNPDGKPYYLRPVDYWDLQKVFWHLRDKYPHLFWNPPLTFDRNPFQPDSQDSKTLQARQEPVHLPLPQQTTELGFLPDYILESLEADKPKKKWWPPWKK